MHHVGLQTQGSKIVLMWTLSQIVNRVLLNHTSYAENATSSPYFAGIILASMFWVASCWMTKLVHSAFPVRISLCLLIYDHRHTRTRPLELHICHLLPPLCLQLLQGYHARPGHLSKTDERRRAEGDHRGTCKWRTFEWTDILCQLYGAQAAEE
jgi:hypothetical protein